jgi:2-succinyl-5-enolpyruvyl-6-hydroxy-3-cyclohexene-1-carboxylate synthase
MSAPNRNTLWGTVIADELTKAGIDAVCLAPGSRCTPLTVALANHESIQTYSHLDERSAAFFALGRAKRTGVPTPLVCTSGTAAANFHPAVIEANQSRVPLLLLTADRPRVLHDSGANQTIDQEALYGDAVRAYRTLPEPEADDRKLRALRTAIARAVGTATGVDPGPVHLNVPFEKPLEPIPTDDIPDGFVEEFPVAVNGRDGPFVNMSGGKGSPDDVRTLTESIENARRGLIVTGPESDLAPDKLCHLSNSTGFPILADPLSGHRFGAHVENALVCGGYDSYLASFEDAPKPDVVLRFGASPTSKTLRQYLRDFATQQFVVDPAGGWREASFTATDLVITDPTELVAKITECVGSIPTTGTEIETDTETTEWRERFARAEDSYWSLIENDAFFEGRVLHDVAALAPDPSTLFVSNSMPVRDLDRFGEPRTAEITALGNRGASGIDGITSTALGAGSAVDDPLVLVTGDLAYYHDMNGLLAIARCDMDATIVLVNNDGGGIFHLLPIEEFDPPFTDFFNTPHGLDFEPTGDLYGFDFERVESRGGFRNAYRESLASEGTQVIEVVVDSEATHRYREILHERVCTEISE